MSGRHHDGDDELLDHRPLIGRVAAGEYQQRRDHPHQPASPAFDDGYVNVGTLAGEALREVGWLSSADGPKRS